MNRYREQKDKLEYEAMVRNPETAYLVSNEEFDKQLEELGWSPSDMENRGQEGGEAYRRAGADYPAAPCAELRHPRAGQKE